jgi:hypothetical protein
MLSTVQVLQEMHEREISIPELVVPCRFTANRRAERVKCLTLCHVGVLPAVHGFLVSSVQLMIRMTVCVCSVVTSAYCGTQELQ